MKSGNLLNGNRIEEIFRILIRRIDIEKIKRIKKYKKLRLL